MKNNRGFLLLSLVAVLSVVASTLIFSYSSRWLFSLQQAQLELRMQSLLDAKKRLLAFAVLQPERYLTDTSGVFQSADEQPSPGYFPCVDLDANGLLTDSETRCGKMFSGSADSGFAPDPDRISCSRSPCVGFLPGRIVSRHYYFSETARFYYFVDERFVHSNPNYSNQQLYRFAPIAPSVMDTAKGGREPVLVINGRSGYVALLIDPGTDGLNEENRDGDSVFVQGSQSESALQDLVVGIHWSELAKWLESRLCAEKEKYIAAMSLESGDGRHWFREYDQVVNPLGANGFEWSCP
ncbi:hypothetical protein [Thiomicrorhabdus sp.]|uniref:hypothetical protein n=1 Tax=Thiomicrorhabdus sp. TaxID=2039724 RepID=UPI0029C94672|nr:hypothetical protein [Thiomicrorhabdus sp.]